jgi:2-polyprenyl-3-methyl-5-hydroxy-6-metoxy-1,4-benzoquinol methylase
MVAEIGSADYYAERTSTYEVFYNHFLLGTIQSVLQPTDAVLDVGCSAGGLFHHLQHPGRKVGIEISPVAADAARLVADEVHVGDVSEIAQRLEPASFDVIICGDVLEHLTDSGTTLGQLTKLLKPSGHLIVCLPNVANWLIRLQLLRGRWDYADWGILDEGHLRFFTMKSTRELLEAQGLVVTRMRGTHAVWLQTPRLAALLRPKLAYVLMAGLAKLRPSLFGFQFIAVARPPGALTS